MVMSDQETPAPTPAPATAKAMSQRNIGIIVLILLAVIIAAAAWPLLPSGGGNGGDTGSTISTFITGYVFADSTRNYRVVGAVVEMEAENKVYSTTTGQHGEYVLAGMPAGTYTVQVKVAGEVKGTDTVTVSEEQVGLKEWNDIAPELVPNGSADGVQVLHEPSGWSGIQSVSVGA